MSRLPPVYMCGRLEVDLGRREIRVVGVPARIGDRAFEIIALLVQSAGELITKDDLMRRVWPGAVVEDNTVEVHISVLRKALGPDRGLLKTTYGRGYRLLGSWTTLESRMSAAVAAPGTSRLSGRSNLPVAGSTLIGRAAVVDQLRTLLSAHRMVTLTGAGGIGKTRLALEAAHRIGATFQDGAWFVQLGSLADTTLVASTAARALELKLAGDELRPEAIASAIGHRRLLLVLDNCEHVVEAAAGLTDAILRLCPQAVVLATSREVLRVEGEHVLRVPPLDVPRSGADEPGEILACSGAKLFIDLMRTHDSGFVLRAEDAPAVAAICRRLDGIPLAIEFAAARAATLGVRQVAAALSDRFALLTVGRRAALPQHRTLRATLDWSYELLPQTEAWTLRMLAVFVGKFPLDAAVAVASDRPDQEVIDNITNLVAKSLVVTEIRDGTPYFELLETIRLYALEKLRREGEWPSAVRRHAEYYRALADRAERESGHRKEAEWIATFGQHLDNWRAALDWAFSPEGDAGIGVSLTLGALPIWFRLSLREECRRRVELALRFTNAEDDPDATMRLSAGLAAALFYTQQSADPEVVAAWTRVLHLAERLDNTEYRLWAHWGLWHHQMNQGQRRGALLSAQAYCAAATDPVDIAAGGRMAGVSHHYLGDHRAARNHFESLLAQRIEMTVSAMIRHQYDLALAARVYLPRILWLQGLPDEAMRAAEAVVRDAAEAGQELGLSLALVHAGCPVSLWTGNLAAAEHFLGMLMQRATPRGPGFWRAEAQCYQAVLHARRGQVAAALQVFLPALQEVLDSKTRMYVTEYFTAMMGALAESAEASEAHLLVADAIAQAERNDDLWSMPELLRLQGEFLLREDSADAAARAETRFRTSLELADRQGALAWALRAATSLAGLMRNQRRLVEARAALLPVRNRFTEGFETADLLKADRLLGELG